MEKYSGPGKIRRPILDEQKKSRELDERYKGSKEWQEIKRRRDQGPVNIEEANKNMKKWIEGSKKKKQRMSFYDAIKDKFSSKE